MRLIDAIAETQRGMADALPVLVMMSDADGVVNFFNRAWFEYTGQPRFERDIGEEWRKYIHPDDVATVGAAWYAGMQSGKDVEVEYRVRHAASGEWRWFSAHARALRDGSGNIAQWIGTAMEIHAAREAKEAFQRAALPPKLPSPFSGMHFDAVYKPSSKDLLVGGDWYDAFQLSNGSLAFSVGDVTGHGLEAAVLMSKIRQSFRAVATRAAQFENNDCGSIISSVEDIMLAEHSDFLASVFFGILNADQRTLEFSNAGHPPPLIYRSSGSVEELSTGDTLLGLVDGAKRTSAKVSLDDAALLVAYTDGLVEATRNLLEGERALRDALRSWPAARVESPALHLLEKVVQPPAADDIAIFTVAFGFESAGSTK